MMTKLIVAYPGYTLQMKKLFPGSPMVHDMHTRRRIGYCWTLIGNSTKGIQSPRVTPNLWSGPPFWNSGAFVILLRPLVRLSSVSCRTTDVINTMRLSQLVDNADHWTLFTAFDRSVWDLGTCGLSFCLGLEGPGFGLEGWGLGLKSLALTTHYWSRDDITVTSTPPSPQDSPTVLSVSI